MITETITTITRTITLEGLLWDGVGIFFIFWGVAKIISALKGYEPLVSRGKKINK